MTGQTRRPTTVAKSLVFKRGSAWENVAIPFLERHFIIDYVEGAPLREDSEKSMEEWFTSTDRVTKWAWKERDLAQCPACGAEPCDPDGARWWEIDTIQRNGRWASATCDGCGEAIRWRRERDFHVWWEYEGEEYEMHFRPDVVIRGIKDFDTGEEYPWPREAWVVVDLKATTHQGMKWGKAYVDERYTQKDVNEGNATQDMIGEPKRPWGWWPTYVAQLMVYMHFLGFEESAIFQSEFEFFDLLMDAKEPKRHTKPPQPEWQWKRPPYRADMAQQLLQRAAMIRGLVKGYQEAQEKGDPPPELPLGCVRGSGYYKSCSYNDQETAGLKSGPCCPGKPKGT